MTLKLMSDDRHEYLVKCAEQVIGLMNGGAKPNSALSKVARDAGLNAKEVTLVSHAVNNSKTLSHLANSKADDKGKPFPLTNAEVVNQQLNDHDPVVPSEKKDLETERKGDLEKKKEAALRTYEDDATYLDAPVVDHAAVFRQACGMDDMPRLGAKIAQVVIKQDGVIDFEDGQDAIVKIGAIKTRAEESRLESTRQRDLAVQVIEKLAGEFRLLDASRFDRIEKIAAHKGCGDETLALIFDLTDIEKLGHCRATGEKLAGLVEVTAREDRLAGLTLQVESLIKAAADAQVDARYFSSVYRELETELLKHGTSMAAQLADDLVAIPGDMMGGAANRKDVVDLYGTAAGSTPAEKGPAFKEEDQTPLSLHTRQDVANVTGRGQIEKLLGDEYIGKHPIQNVVEAFNRARSVNPNLGDAELSNLVRQDLASEGGVPLDTLLRARQAKGVEG